MLKITRREGESFRVGNNIIVTIEKIKGGAAKVSIDAPKSQKILRSELYTLPSHKINSE